MKILITGANGTLGKAFINHLDSTRHLVVKHLRADCDLLDYELTENFIMNTRPELIVHCAGKVGGIGSRINQDPSDYLINTKIDQNVMVAALKMKVRNFLYLSSATIYPISVDIRIPENSILRGNLEDYNSFYALSKISGTNFVTNVASSHGLAWRSLVLSNVYGPSQNYRREHLQIIPGIIKRVAELDLLNDCSFEIRGDLKIMREFTYIPEIVEWAVGKFDSLSDLPPVLNVGSGEIVDIETCYKTIFNAFGVLPEVRVNPNFPVGQMRQMLNSDMARLHGWNPTMKFSDGITETVRIFQKEL